MGQVRGRSWMRLGAVGIGVALLAGCGGGEDDELPPPATPVEAHQPRSAIAACVDGQNDACLKACDGASVDACTIIGLRYGVGRGLPQNEQWARKFFQRACDLGSDPGCSWASADDLDKLRSDMIAACSMGGSDVCHSAPSESDSVGVLVHMTGDPMNLQRQDEVSHAWINACEAPCDRVLPPHDPYRLTAIRRSKSEPFYLEGRPGDRVTLDVDAGKQNAIAGGAVLIYCGAPLAGIGALVAVAGAADSDKQQGGQLIAGGLVTMAIGAALALPGILLLRANVHSHQTQTVERAQR